MLQPWRYQLLCLHYRKQQSVTRHRPLILGEPSPVAQAGSCKPQSSSPRSKCIAASHVAKASSHQLKLKLPEINQDFPWKLRALPGELRAFPGKLRLQNFKLVTWQVSATIVYVQRWSPGTSSAPFPWCHLIASFNAYQSFILIKYNFPIFSFVVSAFDFSFFKSIVKSKVELWGVMQEIEISEMRLWS